VHRARITIFNIFIVLSNGFILNLNTIFRTFRCSNIPTTFRTNAYLMSPSTGTSGVFI
jgi:hypothetical protein